MRARILVCACALSIGACLYPEYGVVQDGGGGGTGAPGAGGTGARGGSAGGAAGVSGVGGRGGGVTGTAGSAGGAAGNAGRGGSGGTAGGAGGTAGGVGGVGGVGGTAGGAGTGGVSLPGTAGSNAGRGGSAAGRGGNTGGTGGSSGGTGGGAGRGGTGGTSGTGGSAGRGGTTGVGGSAGGGGAAGSTVAPSWLPSIAVVYQFDQAPDQLGVEAHGNNALHLEEQGNFLPLLDTTIAIEGNSAKFNGGLQNPTYFQSPGSTLPSVFRTEPTNSWTTGGWFHITATNNQQWLVHDEGPTNFQQGGFFFYVDQQVGKLSSGTAFALCRVGVASNDNPALNNLKEVSTFEDSLVGDVGFDTVVPGNWIHLVCRYNAASNELAIFVGGARRVSKIDTTHSVKSGPGPFLLGCNEPDYCSFIGNMDEVFFATSALIDADINRIYACGIDGSRCRCDGPTYANCGFTAISCANANLPPCNSPTPP